MIKIRNKTFETNSSSMHSLVFSKKKPNRVDYNSLEIKDGLLTITLRSFGWTGPEELGDLLVDADSKLDYIATYFLRQLNWELANDEEYHISYERASNLNLVETVLDVDEFERLINAIKKVRPDFKEFKIILNEDGDAFGEIDHQSQDLLDHLTIDEIINKILFNKGCIIVIDNDNSCYYTDFNPALKPGLNEESYFGGATSYTYNITEKDFEE